jgi:hypothetical protein
MQRLNAVMIREKVNFCFAANQLKRVPISKFTDPCEEIDAKRCGGLRPLNVTEASCMCNVTALSGPSVGIAYPASHDC